MINYIFTGADFGETEEEGLYNPKLFSNKKDAIEYLSHVISELKGKKYVVDSDFDENEEHISCICFYKYQENWNCYSEFSIDPIQVDDSSEVSLHIDEDLDGWEYYENVCVVLEKECGFSKEEAYRENYVQDVYVKKGEYGDEWMLKTTWAWGGCVLLYHLGTKEEFLRLLKVRHKMLYLE